MVTDICVRELADSQTGHSTNDPRGMNRLCSTMNDHASHPRAHLASTADYMGGMLAPASGTYEQLNVFGRATGHRVAVEKGDPLTPLPRGFSWRPVDRR